MIFPLIAAALFQYDSPASVELGDIEVRLFYKETGRLSENILGRKDEFIFHNTIIGEGSAEEAADDLLVTVTMSAGKLGTPEDNHKYTDAPVEIVARNASGKILGRRIHKGVLTSFDGTERKALWLNDVTCAGHVTLTATYAGKSKTAKLILNCGE